MPSSTGCSPAVILQLDFNFWEADRVLEVAELWSVHCQKNFQFAGTHQSSGCFR